MLTQLTPEQTKLMETVKEEWISKLLSNPEVSWETLKDKAEWMYNLGSFKNKKAICLVFDSPLATQIAMNMILGKKSQVESQVRSQVKFQVRSQVRSQVKSQVESQVESQMRSQVESQVGSQVWSQVWSQVGSQVRSQMRSQVESQVWSQKLDYIYPYFGLAYDAGWLSFYDFFSRLKVIKSAKLKKYIEANQLFYEIFYFDGFIFATRLPKTVSTNQAGRLSSKTKGAVEWGDGYRNHFVEGVSFDKELWEKIFKERTITAKEAVSLSNIEQRTVALQFIGWDIPK